jgi:ketosteroid isomerase-like protein
MQRTGQPASGGRATANNAVLLAFYDAFNKGEIDRAVEFLAEDFDWRPAFGRSLLGDNHYSGRDGFRAYYRDIAEVFDRYAVEPMRMEAEGDVVVLTNRSSAHARGSGLDIDQQFTIVYRFRDGLITHGRTFRDRDEALRHALGHGQAPS